MTAEEIRGRNRAYYLKNKDKFRERNAISYIKNKDKYKGVYNSRKKGYMANFHLKRKYGIDENTYNELFSLQYGRCAICGKSSSKYKRKMAVDHDHVTGKNRGLLCVKCNSGLGCFEENPLFFDSAKKYMAKYSQ